MILKTKVKKGSWKPKATYTTALKLVELVENPERKPKFADRDITDEALTTLKSNAELLKTSTRNKDQLLTDQVAATTALGKECQRAVTYIANLREGLKRRKLGKAAGKAAGIGKALDPERSDKVLSGIDSLLTTAADETYGPELAKAGLRPDDQAKLRTFKTNIEDLDRRQEKKKGERKEGGVNLRTLQRNVQDGANDLSASPTSSTPRTPTPSSSSPIASPAPRAARVRRSKRTKRSKSPRPSDLSCPLALAATAST